MSWTDGEIWSDGEMKNLLVPVEPHSSIDAVLDAAVKLARRFESYVEGVPLGPDMPDLVAFDMPVSWASHDQSMWRELADESHRRFEAIMHHQGIGANASNHQGLSYGWAGETVFGDSHVGSYGRIFDLTILGRPGAERGDARMATAEAALFDSGHPVLLIPAIAPVHIGDVVVIAWNQSIETARATALAMPLLKKAKKVFLLTIDEHKVEGPSAEQMAHHLAAHLAPHHVSCEAVARSGKGRSHGEAILEQTMSLGADLLVKGAYTQSRLRQMIFGGATSHIMARAQMPVFMSV
jgi:nucleotide-binding universal stress UspA family protein